MSSGPGNARAGRPRRTGRHTRQRVAAAIDFGTHGSGFAWAFLTEHSQPLAQRRLNFHDEWQDQPAPYIKTRTTLLTDETGAVLDWGHVASRRYKLESRQRPQLRLREKFKMSLFDTSAADAAVSRQLVTAYLSQMYQFAVARIGAASQVVPEEIRWCVTVPAIWRDRERHLMRQAAIDAGMPEDPRRLLIAVEPEVASQYCQGHLELTANPGQTLTGRRLVVVDVGGGTVDITSVQIGARGALTEVGYASGGAHGGMYVDRAFLADLLADRIGFDLFGRLKEEQPETMLEILDEWERQKRHFDPARATPFNFSLPIRLYQAMHQQGVLRRFAQRQGGVDDMIVLRPDEVRAVFDTAVDPILALVDEHFDRLGGARVDHVFLVGGFAQSPYLQRQLRSHLAGRAELLVPPNPASAVLAGAVHYGLNPDAVIARRSARTYGINTNLPFEDGVDPRERLYTSPRNQRLCIDRFAPVVRQGELLPVGTSRTVKLFPVSGDAQLELVMLSCENGDPPRYADDQAAKELGRVQVDLARRNGRLAGQQGVVVTLTFGGTEILVAAADQETGQALSHQMTFASLE